MEQNFVHIIYLLSALQKCELFTFVLHNSQIVFNSYLLFIYFCLQTKIYKAFRGYETPYFFAQLLITPNKLCTW